MPRLVTARFPPPSQSSCDAAFADAPAQAQSRSSTRPDLVLQKPRNGGPFVISNKPFRDVIAEYRENSDALRFASIAFGVVGVALLGAKAAAFGWRKWRERRVRCDFIACHRRPSFGCTLTCPTASCVSPCHHLCPPVCPSAQRIMSVSTHCLMVVDPGMLDLACWTWLWTFLLLAKPADHQQCMQSGLAQSALAAYMCLNCIYRG